MASFEPFLNLGTFYNNQNDKRSSEMIFLMCRRALFRQFRKKRQRKSILEIFTDIKIAQNL